MKLTKHLHRVLSLSLPRKAPAVNVLFHADGEAQKGIGHLVRTLDIALSMNRPIQATFLTFTPNIGKKVLSQLQEYYPNTNLQFQWHSLSKIKTKKSKKPLGRVGWIHAVDIVYEKLLKILGKKAFHVLVSDGKYPWTKKQILELKKHAHIILIDNIYPAAQFSDCLIFPTDHFPESQKKKYPQDMLRTGLDWTWLHPAVRKLQNQYSRPPITFDTALCFGGADPAKLTLKMMQMITESGLFKTVAVALGQAFTHTTQIKEFAHNSPQIHWTIFESNSNIHNTYLQSKFVMAPLGLTLYECTALGVPALVIPFDAENEIDAKEFLSRHPDAGKIFLSHQDIKVFIKTIQGLLKVHPPFNSKTFQIGNLRDNLKKEILIIPF